jgi:signal transduction histidine kinase
MLEEVARLTHMIETLLTMSRADAGQITLQKTTFPFMDLLHEIAGLVGVLAEEKEQKIILEGNGGIALHGDKTFLGQAIMNLLDNAVKYAPAGSEIRLRLREISVASAGERIAELTIENEGPAIPKELRERVFDRFFRIDEARSRDAGGVGLGLSIAKWAVAAHGGEIGIQESGAMHCIFYLRLPIAKAE